LLITKGICVLVGRRVESGRSESCGVLACFARTHAVVVPSNYLLTCVGFEEEGKGDSQRRSVNV
jgi:hypothetical protein